VHIGYNKNKPTHLKLEFWVKEATISITRSTRHQTAWLSLKDDMNDVSHIKIGRRNIFKLQSCILASDIHKLGYITALLN